MDCCLLVPVRALRQFTSLQELLGVQPHWWAAGAKEYPLSLQTLTALEFLLLGLFELRRYQGWKATKQVLYLAQLWRAGTPQQNLHVCAVPVATICKGRQGAAPARTWHAPHGRDYSRLQIAIATAQPTILH